MGSLKDDLLGPGVELRETHISWVFLTPEDVFKVKKPVTLGFLDFGTEEKRRLACEAELRLNRRLSPDVYLGVVPIRLDEEGRHRIGGRGTTVDWAVHMKRLPDEDRADVRLARGGISVQELERIASLLAGFHRECASGEETRRYGSTSAIRFNVLENFEQTRETILEYLEPRQVSEVESWQLRFLEERADLFERRIETGRIRDGHGDLRLEHVYLSEQGEISILDCIEFNDRFRYADVCADVVFLAMDLAWHGRADRAEQLLAFYAREADDFELYSVVDFYESYRAFVRGKIASMVASDPEASFARRNRARAEARRYYLLALASERRAVEPPMLIAVGGLIASGKTTVARALGVELAAPVVENDRTRKAMLGVETTTPLLDAPWQGSYSDELTERTYSELFRRARSVLASGRAVVLDASFRSRAHRLEAKRLAAAEGVPFLFVECSAPETVCRERLRLREQGSSATDGRTEIFDAFRSRFEPVSELSNAEHVVVDTSRALEDCLKTIQAARAVSLGRS
jgi:aminoglycoside phosphotransferase family enzyme/predicted kinase